MTTIKNNPYERRHRFGLTPCGNDEDFSKQITCCDGPEGRIKVDDFPTPPWATRALIEHVLGKPEGRLPSISGTLRPRTYILMATVK